MTEPHATGWSFDGSEGVKVESAVLSVSCPVCEAPIPMRATIEHIDGQHAVLEFSSTAVRAHILLTHGRDIRNG